MQKGIIIKGIGGFYYVKSNQNIIECKARGIFRKDHVIPMVGDQVIISKNEDGQGMIEEILPRKNLLIRPPVSNVDQVIIVFALLKPNPNFQLLDGFLVHGEKQKLSIIICINKVDLEDQSGTLKEIKEIYRNTGYPIIFTSAKKEIGIEKLVGHLNNHINVFAGPSGVGKSSLLNKINENYNLKIGDISKKAERGKHTTRHVELLPFGENGYVADTPGFSSISMGEMEEKELMFYYSDFRPHIGNCKFKTCLHIHEPGCAIKESVKSGKIHYKRYQSYLNFIEEIRENTPY